MTRHDLEKMTVIKLREEAHKFPEIESAHSMHKEELVEVLIKLMGIIEDEPKKVSRKIKKIKKTKPALKKSIAALKVKRKEALDAKDAKNLKLIRKKIRKTKRNLRKLAA